MGKSRVLSVKLHRLVAVAMLASLLSVGATPAAGVGLGEMDVEATVTYPRFPCPNFHLFPDTTDCQGMMTGTVTGSLSGHAGYLDGPTWSVAFDDASLNAEFDYWEPEGQGYKCGSAMDAPRTADGTGTIQGSAIGQLEGESVTGVDIDISFWWHREGRQYSWLEMKIWATVTLLPQNVVVQQEFVFSSFGEGVAFMSTNALWIFCQGDGGAPFEDVSWEFRGIFVPTGGLASYGQGKLIITTEREDGQVHVWYCGVEAHFEAGTTTTATAGWHSHGLAHCNQPVDEIGVTIQWFPTCQGCSVPDDNETDSGICVGNPLIHQLLNEPHEAEDTIDEVTEAVNDLDRTTCLQYYEESWRKCGDPYVCPDFVLNEVRMSIWIPSNTVITGVTQTVKGKADKNFCKSNGQRLVECFFQKMSASQPPGWDANELQVVI